MPTPFRKTRIAILITLGVSWGLVRIIASDLDPAWWYEVADIGAVVTALLATFEIFLLSAPSLVSEQRIDNVEQIARHAAQRINGYDQAIEIAGYFPDVMRPAAGDRPRPQPARPVPAAAWQSAPDALVLAFPDQESPTGA